MTQVVDAARRILRRPPDRKKPLAADQVMRIISRLEKGSLADVQVAVIFAMGFFGFLRCNDLSNVAVTSRKRPPSLRFLGDRLLEV